MSKTGPESKKQTEIHYSDYTPSKDKSRDYLDEVYKKNLKWKKDLRKNMANYNVQNINASSLNWSSINSVNPTPSSIMSVNGATNTVEVTATLEVNGRDVMKELDELRDSLLLLKRHVDMEAKYPRLKEIKDEYERELAKYKTFDTLKESK